MVKMIHLVAAIGALSVAQIGSAAELSKNDHNYMVKTAQGLISEVTLGQMAQKRAGDERVKQFGKRMVEDHGKDLENLRQLASQKKVTLPQASNDEQTKEAAKLGKLSGKDFDQEYIKYEAKDHKEDVEDQGKEMKSTADADLKKFATSAYDTVSKHKQIIDELHGKPGSK